MKKIVNSWFALVMKTRSRLVKNLAESRDISSRETRRDEFFKKFMGRDGTRRISKNLLNENFVLHRNKCLSS